MKKIVDVGGAFGELLANLSKAFDCILYDIIMGKIRSILFTCKRIKNLFTTICQIENKESKLMMHIVCRNIYFVVSRRELYSLLRDLVYTYVTYSTFCKT